MASRLGQDILRAKSNAENFGLVAPYHVYHNAIIHLAKHPKLQKILSQDLHTVFSKCGNVSNTQNSYSLTLWWSLGLYNTSLYASLVFQTLAFAETSNR